ncbi:uncharacterized protein LOC122662273 isoform X3 [Telopea speciosissima]|uniref:uncharacterized protein LOC122662273 isoform X3 n=1 Tax=Telopea speciosissima TaxID=54955 RepID=UPI001CC335AB|nr:uncharacterized protein LOC122662273 isoform X3 [Telopea speciosissima]
MEQQGKNTSVELQDNYENAIQRNHISLGGVITVKDIHLETNCNISMSNEEWKIRADLEADMERDLEEEIKDGICHLAFRLYRLYQHQRDRNARESSRSGNKTGSAFDKKTFSEVNITIKMEGDSKIEINEIKKVAHEKNRPRSTYSSEGKQGNIFPGNTKKFNWVNTLRSGNRTPAVIKNVHGVHPNIKHEVKERRNCKRPVNVANGKLLEVGWRN